MPFFGPTPSLYDLSRGSRPGGEADTRDVRIEGLLNNGFPLTSAAPFTSAMPLANVTPLIRGEPLSNVIPLTSVEPLRPSNLANVTPYRILSAATGAPVGVYVEVVDLATGERLGSALAGSDGRYAIRLESAPDGRALAIQATGLRSNGYTGFVAATRYLGAEQAGPVTADVSPGSLIEAFAVSLLAGVRREFDLSRGFRGFRSSHLAGLAARLDADALDSSARAFDRLGVFDQRQGFDAVISDTASAAFTLGQAVATAAYEASKSLDSQAAAFSLVAGRVQADATCDTCKPLETLQRAIVRSATAVSTGEVVDLAYGPAPAPDEPIRPAVCPPWCPASPTPTSSPPPGPTPSPSPTPTPAPTPTPTPDPSRQFWRPALHAGIVMAGGHVNGATSSATFEYITAIAADAEGNVYVSEDVDRPRLRKIAKGGLVSTLAGGNPAARTDGQGAAAAFMRPGKLAVDGAGNVFLLEETAIRKITPDGEVSTVLVDSGAAFTALVSRPAGGFFVIDGKRDRVACTDCDGSYSTYVGPGGVIDPQPPFKSGYGQGKGAGDLLASGLYTLFMSTAAMPNVSLAEPSLQAASPPPPGRFWALPAPKAEAMAVAPGSPGGEPILYYMSSAESAAMKFWIAGETVTKTVVFEPSLPAAVGISMAFDGAGAMYLGYGYQGVVYKATRPR